MIRTALAALTVAAIVAPVTAEAQSRIIALNEHDEAAYRDAFNAIEAGNWRGVTAALAPGPPQWHACAFAARRARACTAWNATADLWR
jgi:hypothetical protein